MEFRTYARILLRRWPLILLMAGLAAGAALVYAARAPRVYRATAHLSVTPSIIDFYTGEAIQRLLNNYALQLKSTRFAAQIAGRLQPPEPVERVAGKVRAVAASSEYRIAIEVDDADPVRAQQIANAAAAGFVEKIRAEAAGREKRDIEIEVLEEAAVPGAPFTPRPRRDAFGAAILGAIIGAGLAFLLEFWEDTLRTAEEAESLLALPVLGAIPNADTSRRTRQTGKTGKRGRIHGLSGLSGFRSRQTAGRGRLHQAPLPGGGGVPDAADQSTVLLAGPAHPPAAAHQRRTG